MQQAPTGEPIRYEGAYHDIDIKGWVRPHAPARESVPIYAAAVREGMARMAGDVADGLIGHPMCSLRWLDEVLVANFEAGLQRSGRSRSDFDFIPTVCCAISDDEEAAYEACRRTICFYATVRTYAPLWEMHGFGDAAVQVGDAFRSGDLAAMPAAVPDEMVDAYCAAGPAGQGASPRRGGRRAGRRRLPHAADLLHPARASWPPTSGGSSRSSPQDLDEPHTPAGAAASLTVAASHVQRGRESREVHGTERCRGRRAPAV